MTCTFQSGFANQEISKSTKQVHVLVQEGKFGKAIKLAQSLQKRFPNDAELIAEQALAYMYAGNNSLAKNKAQLALKIDPQNHQAHGVLANVYNSMGMQKESHDEYLLSLKYKAVCKSCLERAKKFQKQMDALQIK